MIGPLRWLADIRPALAINDEDWVAWEALGTDLERIIVSAPGWTDQPTRSAWLRRIRAELALHTPPTRTTAGIWQAGAQFLAGYHDLDLRDATGTGHAQLILDHAPASVTQDWRERLKKGALAGIAPTEAHGGSRIREITTRAATDNSGRWRIDGEKCWVSRLEESEAFVTFVSDPAGSISAVVIDAAAPGLGRQVIQPGGLEGWAWGRLSFTGVLVDPAHSLLGNIGDGLAIVKTHFQRFRPLVTACALGRAAGVTDQVRTTLAAKRAAGVLPRVRDNALVELGRAWAEVNAALLLTFHASHRAVDLASRLGKGHGVDTACAAVATLAPLIGAVGFQRHHPIAKARFDLAALQYADGIHDSLYRSGGSELLRHLEPRS